MTDPREEGATAAADTPASMVEAIRWIYLGRRTGVLEVTQEDGQRRLFFRNGELYLPAAHPLAVLVKPRLEAARQNPGGAGRDEALVGLVERIAQTVTSWEGGRLTFQSGPQGLPQGLLGPLPSSLLVMTQAVEGMEDEELLDRLGGRGARFKAVRTDPKILQMAALSAAEYALLQTLSSPRAVGHLLQDQGAPVVRLLARLEAGALVERLPAETPKADSGVVRVDVIGRIQKRVERDLEERPVTLEAQAHREQLADLLARLGELDHYQLLGLKRDVGTRDIHEAFEDLGRRVHPSHADRLGLPGREGALEVLFERAAEAYLTLSDKSRRAEYDRGLAPLPELIPEEERTAEGRKLAQQYYRQALSMVERQDLGGVVDLLKEAVRRDPQPEYFVLMGRVQARNPNWLRHAVDSFERARRQGSEEPEVVVELAELYEKMERPEQARRLFLQVLESQPDNQRAAEGLGRLEEQTEAKVPWWQKLLGG